MPAFFVSRWCPLLATRPGRRGLLCRSYRRICPVAGSTRCADAALEEPGALKIRCATAFASCASALTLCCTWAAAWVCGPHMRNGMADEAVAGSAPSNAAEKVYFAIVRSFPLSPLRRCR